MQLLNCICHKKNPDWSPLCCSEANGSLVSWVGHILLVIKDKIAHKNLPQQKWWSPSSGPGFHTTSQSWWYAAAVHRVPSPWLRSPLLVCSQSTDTRKTQIWTSMQITINWKRLYVYKRSGTRVFKHGVRLGASRENYNVFFVSSARFAVPFCLAWVHSGSSPAPAACTPVCRRVVGVW